MAAWFERGITMVPLAGVNNESWIVDFAVSLESADIAALWGPFHPEHGRGMSRAI
jgi:hypothetical protein